MSKGLLQQPQNTSSRICMRKTTFATPVYQYFTPFSIFTQVYPRFLRLHMSTLVYPHFTPFTLVISVYPRWAPCLAKFMPFYPRLTRLPCFTQFIHFLSRSRMFYPVYPCLPLVIHALLCLLMFTYVCP